MLSWLQKYWPALILLALMVALLDGVVSSLMTCHPVAEQSSQGTYAKEQYECTALAGPILTTLVAIVDFFDGHGEAVTAVFTIVLAAFTGTLWWSTNGMLRATNQSIHIANMEFASTHRPILRLKHIWFATADGQQFHGHIQSETPITVRLDIVNVGAIAANVTLINFVTIVLAAGLRLPQRPPYNEPGITQFPVNVRLESGITLTHAVSDGKVLSTTDILAIRKGEARLYFVGTIEYWDDARRPRGTAFCRYLKFDRTPARPADTGRFEIEKDPDYEYQD
jgi:hypothetical protein